MVKPNMTHRVNLEKLITDTAAEDFVTSAAENSLARMITFIPGDYPQAQPERLPRLGYLFETVAIQKVARNEELEAKKYFSLAFKAWRSLKNLPLNDDTGLTPGLHFVSIELGGEPIPPVLRLAFRIALSGLVADRVSEMRLELRDFTFEKENEYDWREEVSFSCFLAFVLLCRKQGGWNDIEEALALIDRLRALQLAFEAKYLNGLPKGTPQVEASFELVGYYNIAQVVTLAGQYLKHGKDGNSKVLDRIDRFKDQALEAFTAANTPYIKHLTELIWVGCRKLIQNSIWTHVDFSETSKEFARVLAERGRPNPVIELWPSQQDAFKKNLLDPYRKAILVEMPTSAGKTLLAKFAIVQTRALNPNGKIIYIVPTRALVNQVTADLRVDFSSLKVPLRVEQAVPAFELDPTEDKLLADNTDILVTTPEKFDLLIRKEHPVTQEISLVIADEAHNLCADSRGARLELLLGTLKRERAGARFLLLSPFLPNSDELVYWLGEDRALPPIAVDWKPSRTVVGALRLSGRGAKRSFVLETLPASSSIDLSPGQQIKIGPKQAVGGDPSVERFSIAGTKLFMNKGAVLVLCRGRGTAMKRAAQIADSIEMATDPKQEVLAVCRYLETENGPNTPLLALLPKGVAYHHSGLSQESRILIENLIRKNCVNVICGTTTLAQGVNFPISTVIIESLEKGDADLSFTDFWNIAGRAGRALVDTTGIVAFPTPNAERLRTIVEFLAAEAEEICSRLAVVIDQADDIANTFSLVNISRWPELSSLMQFLAHALKVSGNDDLSGEVEDLLRASLIYYQAKKASPEAAKKLILICRSYLEKVKGQKGLLSLADQTGFATPSVLKLLARKKEYQDLYRVNTWLPKHLFGEDTTPLAQRIELIADLPEIQLGRGQRTPFNPEEVAKILVDWVNGARLDSMAQRYRILGEGATPADHEAEFGKYLFSNLLSKASWGMGALETLYLSEVPKSDMEEVGYIPAMIFFGVANKEAVWMRSVGVPRFVSDNLATLWRHQKRGEPESYNQIRSWLKSIPDNLLKSTIPQGSKLTVDDMKILINNLVM